MKILKKVLSTMIIIIFVVTIVFFAGRYGWKLIGFDATQSAGIRTVKVDEKTVHIQGFYPGSFPEGFCGYYSEEKDGKLYIGFRFSSIFGFFEKGEFDISIPVQQEIDEVILKTRMNEYSIWKIQK